MSRYHIRRTDKEIRDERVTKKILRSTSYVTIAMSLNDQPYLVSLSHGYDEKRNCIYFHCAREGKKMDYLKANNKIWGQALLDYGCTGTREECTHLYASVHFSGRVTFLESAYEKLEAIACMAKQLGVEPKLATTEYKRFEETEIGRVEIDSMSGKKSEEVSVQIEDLTESNSENPRT